MFVQFQKNSAHHSGIKRSPWSALLCEEVCQCGTRNIFSATGSAQQPGQWRRPPDCDYGSAIHINPSIRSSILCFQCTSILLFPVFQHTPFPFMWILWPQKVLTRRKWWTYLWQLSLNKHLMSTVLTSMHMQAEWMVKSGGLQTGKPGDNVAVPVPLLDHSRGEPQNIPGMTACLQECKNRHLQDCRSCWGLEWQVF